LVDTREIAIEYRLSHWAQIMQERAESGLSIRAFCKQMGMHENRYYYWQHKLRKAACNSIQSNETTNNIGTVVPKGWVSLCPANSLSTQTILIELGGVQVTVSHDTDTNLLAKVCKVLKTI